MKKQVNDLTPERARALLGKKEISDEKLLKVLERIKAFCKVAYQLYSKLNNKEAKAVTKDFDSEPPNEFTNAA